MKRRWSESSTAPLALALFRAAKAAALSGGSPCRSRLEILSSIPGGSDLEIETKSGNDSVAADSKIVVVSSGSVDRSIAVVAVFVPDMTD